MYTAETVAYDELERIMGGTSASASSAEQLQIMQRARESCFYSGNAGSQECQDEQNMGDPAVWQRLRQGNALINAAAARDQRSTRSWDGC
jgi:hypothetical protein